MCEIPYLFVGVEFAESGRDAVEDVLVVTAFRQIDLMYFASVFELRATSDGNFYCVRHK